MTVNGDWRVERNWSSGIERDREKCPFTVNITKEAVVSKVNKESIWENSEGGKDVIT